jgi:hypothetical protein
MGASELCRCEAKEPPMESKLPEVKLTSTVNAVEEAERKHKEMEGFPVEVEGEVMHWIVPRDSWSLNRIDEEDGEIRYEAHGPRGSFITFEGPNNKADADIFMAAAHLRAENESLREALTRLMSLHEHLHDKGKDNIYEIIRPGVMALASKALLINEGSE